jgi:hypothetical protein
LPFGDGENENNQVSAISVLSEMTSLGYFKGLQKITDSTSARLKDIYPQLWKKTLS